MTTTNTNLTTPQPAEANSHSVTTPDAHATSFVPLESQPKQSDVAPVMPNKKGYPPSPTSDQK